MSHFYKQFTILSSIKKCKQKNKTKTSNYQVTLIDKQNHNKQQQKIKS